MYIYMYVCIYICIYICLYVYIYIYMLYSMGKNMWNIIIWTIHGDIFFDPPGSAVCWMLLLV